MSIDIKDKAFEKIFEFFDEYNWHLDTKITATVNTQQQNYKKLDY